MRFFASIVASRLFTFASQQTVGGITLNQVSSESALHPTFRKR
jgi:hypothetical protein